MTSTASKLVDFRTERRKRNSRKREKLHIALLESVVAEDLAELDRLFARESETIVRALTIPEPGAA